MSSSTGNSHSEHPSPIPSERTTEPDLAEIHAMPLEELVRTLANHLLSDREWRRDVTRHLKALVHIPERLAALECQVAAIPKRGEQ